MNALTERVVGVGLRKDRLVVSGGIIRGVEAEGIVVVRGGVEAKVVNGKSDMVVSGGVMKGDVTGVEAGDVSEIVVVRGEVEAKVVNGKRNVVVSNTGMEVVGNGKVWLVSKTGKEVGKGSILLEGVGIIVVSSGDMKDVDVAIGDGVKMLSDKLSSETDMGISRIPEDVGVGCMSGVVKTANVSDGEESSCDVLTKVAVGDTVV